MSKTKRRYSSAADPTRERILKATLACISRTAVRDLSVRAIAAAADVNVAAVHYYFHTKDALIAEVMGHFYAGIIERFDRIVADKGPARERLESFLLFYMEQFRQNPGIFASILETMTASSFRRVSEAPEDYRKVLTRVVDLGKERLFSLVREVAGIEDPQIVAFRTVQVLTAAIHPMIISDIAVSMFGMDFTDPATQKRYVRLLVDSIEHRPADGSPPEPR